MREVVCFPIACHIYSAHDKQLYLFTCQQNETTMLLAPFLGVTWEKYSPIQLTHTQHLPPQTENPVRNPVQYTRTYQQNIQTLEKWFPLQGERAQSLKVFNVRMLVFKNNIEMRKKRGNKVITFSTYILHVHHLTQNIQFSIIVALPCIFPSNLHAHMRIGGH